MVEVWEKIEEFLAVVAEKAKVVVKFIYNWVTVLAASLVGAPAVLIDILNGVMGLQFEAFVSAPTALKIVTGIGIVKAVLAAIQSWLERNRPVPLDGG
jgi:hypothetical protein